MRCGDDPYPEPRHVPRDTPDRLSSLCPPPPSTAFLDAGETISKTGRVGGENRLTKTTGSRKKILKIIYFFQSSSAISPEQSSQNMKVWISKYVFAPNKDFYFTINYSLRLIKSKRKSCFNIKRVRRMRINLTR